MDAPAGDPLIPFSGGWAIAPFSSRACAHFWDAPIRDCGVQYAYARCGCRTFIVSAVPMLAPGNAPFCKRCERVLETEDIGNAT